MTISKRQRPILFGNISQKGIFSHDQLYIAAFRATDPLNILFIIPRMEGTKNIVIKFILNSLKKLNDVIIKNIFRFFFSLCKMIIQVIKVGFLYKR